MASPLEFQIESFLLYVKRDVRNRFWIILIVSLVLAYPFILLGGVSSSLFRAGDLQFQSIVSLKNVQQQNYVISEVQAVDLVGGQKLLYATINNKQNTQVGFWPWVYEFEVLDSSQNVLEKQRINSYLLPEEVKFVTVTTSKTGADSLKISEIPSQTQAVIYNSQASQVLQMPNISLLRNEVLQASAKNSQISITLRNDDNVFIEALDVLYLIRDSRGAVIGAETTRLNGFAPATTRDISLNYPQATDRIARTVEVRWSVNYLDSSQIRLP